MIGKKSANGKAVIKTLVIGAALTGLGLLWNLLFPINKPLWTSSYVLYTAGIAMMVLAVIYLGGRRVKVQMMGQVFYCFWHKCTLFIFPGRHLDRLIMLFKIPSNGNEISIYTWFYEKICVPVAGNMNGSLMFAIIQMLLSGCIAFVLYRRKIMIRL